MDILEVILVNISSYIGPGNFAYFPLVSKYTLDIYKNTYPTDYNLTYRSIALSSGACLKHAVDIGLNLSYEDYHKIAYNIKTLSECSEVSSFLLKRGIKWDVNSMYCAIQSTNIAYFKWVEESGVKWSEDNAIQLACSHGNTEIVLYLCGIGIYPSNICGSIAANFDRKDLLIWLHSNKFINSDFMIVLAECGFIETLKYFINSGVECHGDILDYAAGNGNLDIVRYLIDENICDVTYSTINFAASSGCRETANFFVNSYNSMFNEYTMDIIGRYCDI